MPVLRPAPVRCSRDPKADRDLSRSQAFAGPQLLPSDPYAAAPCRAMGLAGQHLGRWRPDPQLSPTPTSSPKGAGRKAGPPTSRSRRSLPKSGARQIAGGDKSGRHVRASGRRSLQLRRHQPDADPLPVPASAGRRRDPRRRKPSRRLLRAARHAAGFCPGPFLRRAGARARPRLANQGGALMMTYLGDAPAARRVTRIAAEPIRGFVRYCRDCQRDTRLGGHLGHGVFPRGPKLSHRTCLGVLFTADSGADLARVLQRLWLAALQQACRQARHDRHLCRRARRWRQLPAGSRSCSHRADMPGIIWTRRCPRISPWRNRRQKMRG